MAKYFENLYIEEENNEVILEKVEEVNLEVTLEQTGRIIRTLRNKRALDLTTL